MSDPECPCCGCQQTKTLREQLGIGRRVIEEHECLACRARFNHARPAGPQDEDPDADEVLPLPRGVRFYRMACKCGSLDIHVASTPTPGLRWHKCRGCGRTWKSSEVVYLAGDEPG